MVSRSSYYSQQCSHRTFQLYFFEPRFQDFFERDSRAYSTVATANGNRRSVKDDGRTGATDHPNACAGQGRKHSEQLPVLRRRRWKGEIRNYRRPYGDGGRNDATNTTAPT